MARITLDGLAGPELRVVAPSGLTYLAIGARKPGATDVIARQGQDLQQPGGAAVMSLSTSSAPHHPGIALAPVSSTLSFPPGC